MPIYRDVFNRSKDPVAFRAVARELYDLPNGCWRPWEEDIFLPAMRRHSEQYIYSEKERRKLAELCWFSEEACGHDGTSVIELVARCFYYKADIGNDQDWIIGIHRTFHFQIKYGCLTSLRAHLMKIGRRYKMMAGPMRQAHIFE